MEIEKQQIETKSYDWLLRAIKVAYMRGYQVGRRYEIKKIKGDLKWKKKIILLN